MQKWLIFILFLTACAGPTDYAVNDVLSDSQGIVGGTIPPLDSKLNGQALHFVRIWKENPESRELFRGSCTATPIAPRIVLTAAHCLKEGAIRQYINLISPEGKKSFIDVIETYGHPEYKGKLDNSDIAILHLKEALPKYVQILTLPTRGQNLKLQSIVAAGFGRTDGRPDYAGGLNETLHSTTLDVLKYHPTHRSFMVDQSKGRGFCQGDSGGPAILKVGQENYVVGIAARTHYFQPQAPASLDLCNFQGEYTNVQFFVEWIFSIMDVIISQDEAQPSWG